MRCVTGRLRQTYETEADKGVVYVCMRECLCGMGRLWISRDVMYDSCADGFILKIV